MMDKSSCCKLFPVDVSGSQQLQMTGWVLILTLPISMAFCSNTRLSINYILPFRFRGYLYSKFSFGEGNSQIYVRKSRFMALLACHYKTEFHTIYQMIYLPK